MQFSSARAIEQVVWQLRLADYPRSLNRSRINSLANGAAPYTDDEVTRNAVEVNVNDLSLTRLCHDARSQLLQGFNKPGAFFKATTDGGATSKRQERSVIVTKEVARLMKQSDFYFECLRSKLAQTVLHGIGPSNWEDADHWCPIDVGVEEVYVPSNTRLTLRNLPFFAIYRPYTAYELRRLTRHKKAATAAGWNLEAVDRAVRWADEQSTKLYGGATWSEYWSPEKRQERFKQDAGIYASDLVQTIDCLDFYYWDDAKRHEGWRRRIIFDAWGGWSAWFGVRSYGATKTRPTKNLIGEDKSEFVFSSGDRVFADKLDQIVHFQFADLSAVAPFRYHSVRSLGFLLYAACHLQNRLRCAFSEAVFENLMMYLRAHSEEEAAKALYVQLANRKFIDNSIQFVPAAERWQPNYQLAELGLNEQKQVIADNSASYVQNQNMSRDRVEKTKFQVMAEVQAMQTLVSAALQHAYRTQTSEYREVFRRFLRPHSRDPEVQEFRARCLARGVPEKLLVTDAWDIEPERILGGGNKTMEMAIAQQLWEMRAAFAPDAQQQIQRDVVLAITDDAARADSLVPATPSISNDRHDAMVAFGSLMVGASVALTRSQNRIEVAQVWLGELGLAVQQATQQGNMVSPDRVMGFQNVLKHVSNLIAEIGQDAAQKETAKRLAEVSGQLANAVKGFAQRLQQAAKASASGNGEDKMAETKAKIAGTLITAQAKAENTRESHAQRTAQKQVSFERQEEQKEQTHQLEMRRTLEQQRVDEAAELTRAAADAEIARAKAAAAPKPAAEE